MHDRPALPPWHAADLAERERDYSPSSCIGGDYRPWLRAYAERSASARSQTEAAGARWIEGRWGSAATQRMDLGLPAGQRAGGHALLLFIHGGYWQELSARDSLFAAAGCLAHGHAYAALDHTLAPQATVAEIVDECCVAFDWLVAQADALGIARDRIVLAGSSAGAHLAAMVALHARQRVRAAVLVSGIYDLAPLVGTSINQALGLDHDSARAVSPLHARLDGLAPALLAVGEVETDAFKQQNRAFAQAVERAGTPCRVLEVARRNHFDIVLELTDPHSELGRRTLDLLDRERPAP